MVTVKVLGSGCTKCKTLTASVQDVIAKNNLDATVTKVEDIVEIMKYGILTTPGLVVNEKVKSAGSLPKEDQILTWITEG
jgi:small redox-active disulfide protein 2